jgi:hypothetical protein
MTVGDDAGRIESAIDESDQLLRNLAEPIRSRPDLLLLDGDRTVRDTLCHVTQTHPRWIQAALAADPEERP